jgi:hypothetical protein
MGLIKKDDSIELKVYLTDLGRKRLLEQGFVASTFSLSDDDINYNNHNNELQYITDITGDYDDNVYSLNKNVKIKNQIIL